MGAKHVRIQQIPPSTAEAFLEGGFLIDRHTGTAGELYPPHFHDYLELELVCRGTVELSCNEKKYTVGEGCAYLCTGNDIHSVRYLTDTELINLGFSGSLLGEELSLQLLSPAASAPVQLSGQELAHVTELLELLFSEQRLRPALSRLRAAALISELVILILRGQRDTPHAAPPGCVQAAVIRMHRDFREPLTLVSLARDANLSPGHFGRLFREATGVSVREYLNTLRLRHASKLLIASGLSVKEIAFACGYRSVEYFMHCFREEKGTTPGKYRAAFAAKTHGNG